MKLIAEQMRIFGTELFFDERLGGVYLNAAFVLYGRAFMDSGSALWNEVMGAQAVQLAPGGPVGLSEVFKAKRRRTPAQKPLTICSARPLRRSGSMRLCTNTGAWKTACTGGWMW